MAEIQSSEGGMLIDSTSFGHNTSNDKIDIHVAMANVRRAATNCPAKKSTGSDIPNNRCQQNRFFQNCFLKTFIDIMFLSRLFYVFTFLSNIHCLLFTVILSRLTSCNYVAVCQPLLRSHSI